MIRLGGVPNLGDESKFQGAPRDLLVIDEAANVLEEQARFLLGWLRSADPKQRVRALFCSNPPGSAEGESRSVVESLARSQLSGRLGFVKMRAEAWWRFREALAPERPVKVALPRDQRLFAGCAHRATG